jgi:hypothetical protein
LEVPIALDPEPTRAAVDIPPVVGQCPPRTRAPVRAPLMFRSDAGLPLSFARKTAELEEFWHDRRC